MKIAEYALKNRKVTVFTSILLLVFGVIAYLHLGRLANPTFTIKIAVITTSYPGASPKEVAEEVTDVLEEAVQSMSELDFLESTSQEGMSIVYVNLKENIGPAKIQQTWDILRKKISDVQYKLPPGAGPSRVDDDFGDVFGIFYALTGKDYSFAELKDAAKYLKKELLLVKNVAKIEFWGVQQEAVYVEFNRSKLNNLGISPAEIAEAIQNQNMVEQTGKVKVKAKYLRFQPSGELRNEKTIEDIYLGKKNGKLIRLMDVAKIKRGYIEPKQTMLEFDGEKAIGIGISLEKGGNIIKVGKEIKKRLKVLEPNCPPGMKLHAINYQPERVQKALSLFLENLIEAVAIVIIILLIFMGFRAGLLIGLILLTTIWGTFAGMWILGIELQNISLGALIIALGMLVDNAIVVTDGFLIKRQLGIDRITAAVNTVNETQWPLLGATFIAILAFTAIGFSPGNTGEFCRSIFWVMLISLMLSWMLAVTLTPLLCILMLPNPKKSSLKPYKSIFHRKFKSLLEFSIHKRIATIIVLLILIMVGMYGFTKIPSAFFSRDTRNQFYIDYWKPESTHIDDTAKDTRQIEKFLQKQKNVKSVTSFIGEGSLRFLLSYNYQSPDSSYGQLIVEVDKFDDIQAVIASTETFLKNNFINSEAKVEYFYEGPPVEYAVEVRVRGRDEKVIKQLASQIKEIIHKDGGAKNIRDDWRQPVKVLRPHYSEMQSRRSGVTRSDLNKALLWNFNGYTCGVLREKDELLPIISRATECERSSLDQYRNIQVWSNLAAAYIPINQIIDGMNIETEDPIIKKRDRVNTITVQCDAAKKEASLLRQRILPEINSIKLPPGYSLEWGGAYEETEKALVGIKKIFPFCMIGMFFILVWLFNSFRNPFIIFMLIPLASIGVVGFLLPFNLPFGFMAVIGFLGLIGMMIKNAIVLLDQINIELRCNKTPYEAIVDASVSRLRPVTMASGTTILGVIPLLWSTFFASMAATIIGGLIASTALTLLVVPVLYSIFFKVKINR